MPPPLLRRLLPPVLAAVLALAVAVPITWYVATSYAGADPAPPVDPTGPANRNELRQELLAQLPGRATDGAVLMEVVREQETATGLPPGRYQVHLICGQLRRQRVAVPEVSFFLATPADSWRVTLPCPSHPLTLPEELDFTGEAAGAVSIIPDDSEGGRSTANLVLLQFVPVGGGD